MPNNNPNNNPKNNPNNGSNGSGNNNITPEQEKLLAASAARIEANNEKKAKVVIDETGKVYTEGGPNDRWDPTFDPRNVDESTKKTTEALGDEAMKLAEEATKKQQNKEENKEEEKEKQKK